MTNTALTTRESRTPAFHRMQVHERDLTRRLRAGFEEIDGILMWVLDASKFTLGYLADDFGRDLLTDTYRVSALTADGDGTQGKIAQDIVERDLAPAFNSARAFVRHKAQDHDQDVDASKQEHTALIPRVDVVGAAQRKAVEWALGIDDQTDHPGPVESREDITDWLNQVGFATTAFIPHDLANAVTTLGTRWRRQLVRSRGVMLRVLIARDLLPAMNKAINHAAKDGMEQDQHKHTSTTGGSIS